MTDHPQPELPNMPEKNQPELFGKGQHANSGPVTCLGMTFENDTARRDYFTGLLREKLKDPAFRAIEGFPIGEDEDILALSDPPYYTACPNPWIDDFIAQWEAEKPKKPEGWTYHREPFAADVSEGKYHPIYKLHPYPTKVPHRAIMRYILHYTEPGDIVFDGFCGTGMTGVAAQLCGSCSEIEELGYNIDPQGIIYKKKANDKNEAQWMNFSRLGKRYSFLNDLSPAASFISNNFTTPINNQEYENEFQEIISSVEQECGWMFLTKHSNGMQGIINYTVWSDVFICDSCQKELIFWNVAVDFDAGKILRKFRCPHCNSITKKNDLERVWVSYFDPIIGETIKQAKQVPVFINYSVNGKRFQKEVDEFDIALLSKIQNLQIPHNIPCKKLPKGFNTEQPKSSHGITHMHHFYTKRNLWILSSIYEKITNPKLLLLLTKVAMQITKLYRFTHQSGVWGAGGGPLTGTLYIPSLIKELSILDRIKAAFKGRMKINDSQLMESKTVINTSSLSDLKQVRTNSIVDYIFLDPPFGSNKNYSEMAFIWETWLQVWTNNEPEAIENSIQSKGKIEYSQLLYECLQEAYRLLKPGRWITIEFSNTSASIWNIIQTSLMNNTFANQGEEDGTLTE